MKNRVLSTVYLSAMATTLIPAPIPAQSPLKPDISVSIVESPQMSPREVGLVPGLYGLTSGVGEIHAINATTGEATFLVTSNEPANLVGLSFLNREAYGSDLGGLSGDSGSFDVGLIDPTSGAVDFISDQGGSSNWHGLAADESAGLLYSIDIGDGYILKSLAADGTISSIGTGTGIDGRGMAFDDANGILYATDHLTASLYTVSLIDGTATLIGPTGLGSLDRVGLAYDENSDILYLNDASTASLYAISVIDGGATLVGANFLPNIDGLAWVGETQGDSFLDDFSDGFIDESIYSPINSQLSEDDGRLFVTVLEPGGGVAIVNPLPHLPPISKANPNQAWAYRIEIDPPFESPGEGELEIAALGPSGEVIELATYDNSIGRILVTERNPFGEVVVSDDGGFDRTKSQRRDKKRSYSLLPPACKGPACSYGFDYDDGLLFVARWRFGIAAPLEGLVVAPVLGGIRVTSSESFALQFIQIEAAEELPDEIETTWSISEKRINQNGGDELVISGENFTELSPSIVEVGGVMVENVEIVSDSTLRFTTPPGSVGPTEVVYRTENGELEVVFDTMRYFAGLEPLILQKLPLQDATLGREYSAQISADGGTGPHEYILASGFLPLGVKLAADGQLAGIPQEEGTFAFFVYVKDTSLNEDVQLFFLEVYGSDFIFSDGFETGDTSLWSSLNPWWFEHDTIIRQSHACSYPDAAD